MEHSQTAQRAKGEQRSDCYESLEVPCHGKDAEDCSTVSKHAESVVESLAGGGGSVQVRFDLFSAELFAIQRIEVAPDHASDKDKDEEVVKEDPGSNFKFHGRQMVAGGCGVVRCRVTENTNGCF